MTKKAKGPSRWVFVEHETASERNVIEDVGVVEMTEDEVAELNKKLVRTMCRFYPAKDFKR